MTNSDYRIRDLIATDACTNCRLCAEVCPAVSAGRDGCLSGVYRLGELKKLLRSRSGLFARLLGKKGFSPDRLKAFSERVFRCTLCGNCEEICPVGLSLRDLWFSLRRDLVHSEAYPEKIDMIRENLMESHNVFHEDNDERAGWVEEMREAPEDGFIRERADVVYFTGCVASFYPMAQKIPMALVRIFESTGVNFTLLGEEEWCCGFPLLGAGLQEEAREVIAHNMDAVMGKGAKKIVFACPSCYQMWREHYPKGFEPLHATQFLGQLVREGLIQFRSLPLTVTYHDPCDLGRGSGLYDAPRDIIRAIPGIRFVELARSRENCRCCGGGGNLEMIDPGLSAGIAKEKIDDVMSTGASAVVTACQQCLRIMNTFVKRNKVDLEVLDIEQIVERAMITGKAN